MISKKSKLLTLNPQLDSDEILRVSGRLVESPLLEEQRFPIILPKGHGYVTSLIKKVHLDNKHAPVDWIHFHIRQQYWLMSSKQQIKVVLRKCFACQKVNARRGEQIMAPLPAVRVHYSPPFTKVGVDYTAKFPVKMTERAKVTHPCYIALFTCLVTRAVHVELVLSNETEQFLQALRRMMSTRGTPTHIYSDNAKCFKRADKLIVETVELNNQVLKDAAKKYEFKWSYSTELHSSGGGAWERAIKAIKHPLRKVMDRDEVVSYVDFLTLVKTIEAQVNDRPLVSSSEDSFDVITPSMLCLGRRIALWQDYYADTQHDSKSDERIRWQQRKDLDEQLRKLWLKQYLPELQQRHQWFTKTPNLRVGDLVLVEEENKKQHQWPVARVQRVIKSQDGLVRNVILNSRGHKKLIKRSIHEIFPLETCRKISDTTPPLSPKQPDKSAHKRTKTPK